MTTDKKMRKEAYTAPTVEVIRVENEGVIASSPGISGGNEGYNQGTLSNSRSTRGYNSASSSDLEDLINDILTVEN